MIGPKQKLEFENTHEEINTCKKSKNKNHFTSWEEEEAEDGDDSHVAVRRFKRQVQDDESYGGILYGRLQGDGDDLGPGLPGVQSETYEVGELPGEGGQGGP